MVMTVLEHKKKHQEQSAILLKEEGGDRRLAKEKNGCFVEAARKHIFGIDPSDNSEEEKSEGEERDAADGNCCIHFDREGRQAKDKFTPMTKEDCGNCFGKDGEHLVDFLNKLMKKGPLDVQLGMTEAQEAAAEPGGMCKVAHKRLWKKAAGKQVCAGDVVCLKNCFSPFFARKLAAELDELKCIPSELVGSSATKIRPVRVVAGEKADLNEAVFILGNERVPVAAQRASTCEQFAVSMVRFLFTKTDKKVIRGRVPEGKHCAGWLRDNELMHNNVSTVRDVNGLHSDASVHHCHSLFHLKRDGNNNKVFGEVTKEEGIGKEAEEVFMMPSVESMRVGTLVVMEESGDMDLSECTALSHHSETKVTLSKVAVGARDVHLQFCCQEEQHQVKGNSHFHLQRGVLAVRQSLLPFHPPFKSVLEKANVREDRIAGCSESGVWTSLGTGGSRMQAGQQMATGAAHQGGQPSGSEEGTANPEPAGKEKTKATAMPLRKFELAENPELKAVFDDLCRKETVSLWKFLVHPRVLEGMAKKAGLHVTVEEPSKEVLERECQDGLQKKKPAKPAAGRKRKRDSSSGSDESEGETEQRKPPAASAAAGDVTRHVCGVAPSMKRLEKDDKGDWAETKQDVMLSPGDLVEVKTARAAMQILQTDLHKNTWRAVTKRDLPNGAIVSLPGKNDFSSNCAMMEDLETDPAVKQKWNDELFHTKLTSAMKDTFLGGTGGNQLVTGSHGQDLTDMDVTDMAVCGTTASAQDEDTVTNRILRNMASQRTVIALFHPCDVEANGVKGLADKTKVVQFLGLCECKGHSGHGMTEDEMMELVEACPALPESEHNNASCRLRSPLCLHLSPHAAKDRDVFLTICGRGEVLKTVPVRRKEHEHLTVKVSKTDHPHFVDEKTLAQTFLGDEDKWKALLNAAVNHSDFSPEQAQVEQKEGSDEGDDEDDEDNQEVPDKDLDKDEEDETAGKQSDLSALVAKKLAPENTTEFVKNLMPLLAVSCCARLRRKNVSPGSKGPGSEKIDALPQNEFGSLMTLLRCTPMPFPVRTFDLGTSCCMKMVMESNQQDSTSPDVTLSLLECETTDEEGRANLLLTSFLMRLFGNVEAFEWFRQNCLRGKQGLFGLESALALADAVCETTCTGQGKSHQVLQRWISPHLANSAPHAIKCNSHNARDFITKAARGIKRLSQRLTSIAGQTVAAQGDAIDNRFLLAVTEVRAHIDKLCTNRKDCTKTGFLALQIMADQHSVCRGQPWGDPCDAIFVCKGCGGDQGLSIWKPTKQKFQELDHLVALNARQKKLEDLLKDLELDVKCHKTSHMLHKQATDEILESLKFDCSEDQLAMIMMKRTEDGTVVDKFTGKEIDGFFVEHSPGCKMHKVLHRARGGSSLNVPKPARVHAHPTPTAGLHPASHDEIADSAVAACRRQAHGLEVPATVKCKHELRNVRCEHSMSSNSV